MPPSPRVVAKKKQNMLKAASEMFLANGYEDMHLDHLIEKVGGSKAFIYNNFENKQGLFIAVVEYSCSELLQPLEGLDPAEFTLETGLTELARRYLNVSLDQRSIMLHRLIIAERLQFPEIGAVFNNAGPRVSFRIAARFIAAQQEMGNLSERRPAADLATIFLGMINAGYLTQMLTSGMSRPGTEETDARISLAVDTFLNGLA
ncbi:MAG: TetR/AcrR family transcriptional regulator C-terminal domain-containing protein [Pseudomonadota bacterium]|nr:TetR/AcrR family transcriptional regulator C-terminal domain-containing protein [Pseudomonadota bacterium]